MESIPLLVREARTLATMSQQEIARHAGMPQSTVGRIEAGLVSPTIETLTRILAAAGFELGAELRPLRAGDGIVDAYRKDIDRTLLRENLKKTPEKRVESLQALVRLADEARRAGRRLRGTA